MIVVLERYQSQIRCIKIYVWIMIKNRDSTEHINHIKFEKSYLRRIRQNMKLQ